MKNYSALKFVAGVLKFVGWAIIVVDLIIAISALTVSGGMPGYPRSEMPMLVFGLFLIAGLVFVFGIVVVASGQIIDLFIDIATSAAVLPQIARNSERTVSFFEHVSSRANSGPVAT